MSVLVQSISLLTGLLWSKDNENGVVGKGEGYSHKSEEAP